MELSELQNIISDAYNNSQTIVPATHKKVSDAITAHINSQIEQIREELTTQNSVVEFSYRIPFDKPITYMTGVMTEDITLIPITDTAVAWNSAKLSITADGSSNLYFSDVFKKTSDSDAFDNTNGTVSIITFQFDGVNYFYTIKTTESQTLSFPTLTSIEINTADGDDNILLTYDRLLDEASTPTESEYELSDGKVIQAISVSGYIVTINVTVPYIPGDVVALTYTGSTLRTKEGYTIPTFSLLAVTNNL